MWRSMIVAAVVGIAPAAWAQVPAGGPEAMPFDIPYGTPISLADARRVAAAAEAEATLHHWKMAIAIVEPSGDLVFYEKMPDTQYSAVLASQAKARAAATYRRATKVFQGMIDGGHPYQLSLPGMAGAAGGVPIVVGGRMIGAIGIGGGSSDQDDFAATMGAKSLE